MSTTYDVLGDPNEYEEWLASQQPPEPAIEHKQENVPQQIKDLPEDIVQVVSHLDEHYVSAIVSAYQRLQLSRRGEFMPEQSTETPISPDRVPGGRESHRDASSRSMARWELQQAVWARQQGSISRKVHRPVPNLAMSTVRAAEWRDKKELIGVMEAAIPFTERGAGGGDVWPLQLRNNWTRHVPLGNMFSGLFVEIKEKTQAEQAAQLVTICRPEMLEPHLFPASAPGGLPISAAAAAPDKKAQHRSWASSDYLADRLQHFSTYMKEVRPHQPEAVAVLGHSVQPTCLSSHITLDDLVASLRLEQGEVAAALVKARDSLHEQARLQHEYEAKQAAAAAALLAAEKAKPKGPLMELSSQRLLFECASGTSSSAVLSVTNTGSTALYYRWERIAPPPRRQEAPVLFRLHDQTGSVLPAALHTFCFQFSPTANGMYAETWVLHTHPSTPLGPCPITLRGVAVEANVLGRNRRKVTAMLADREKSSKVASALERVLADVKPVPLAAPVLSLEQQQQEGVFNNANAALQPAVYYSPDAYKALDALYADLLQATAASVPVPEVKKGAKPAKAAASPVPAVFPEQWDASLDSLASVHQQLSTQDASAADKFGQRLTDAKQALLVPQHSQILHRHAIRLLVQQAADSIDSTADTVKQACIEKEQRRTARTVPVGQVPKGGKAPAAAVAVPAVYSSVEFKHDLMAPVQQMLGDTLDHIPTAILSEEKSVSSTLQQQLVQAQQQSEMQADPQAAVQQAWDRFTVFRLESHLGLSKGTHNPHKRTTTAK